MEATIKIPLSDYLDPESFEMFLDRCAVKKQTPSARVAFLIRDDISPKPEDPKPTKEATS